MKLIVATLENRSICRCGFDLVREEIPTHKKYIVDVDSISKGSLTCGGCGKMTDVHLIATFESILGSYRMDGTFALEALELHPETVFMEA